ncbi:cytochrome c biogenesis CcdA family protein [Clostridium homopropionicum]|nr:cytochrome c biogenesis CcdA family protein [Clostridium homopropionicum]
MNLNIDSSLISVLLIVFSTGFIGGLSPCTFLTVAFIIAYVSGNTNYSKKRGFILSLFFILGIALMLSILGAFAGLLGNVLLKTDLLNYIIAFVLILMGFWLLDVFNFSGNGVDFKHSLKNGSGLLGSFLLGIPFGIFASPCTMPIAASALAYSAIKGSPLYGMILMFTFAIGRSLPLLVAGTFTGVLTHINWLSKYQHTIEKIGGIIMIILALYFIWIA